MPKKTPRQKSKEKAWAAFSLFIRTRDSLKTTGTLDWCMCVSCGDRRPRTGMYCIQAGHFIAGRNNAVLFSEEGVHGQCQMCNHGIKGRKKPHASIVYYQFMEAEYGREAIDRMVLESNRIVKYRQGDYEQIEREYTDKLAALL